MTRRTIYKGIEELKEPDTLKPGRARQDGGGRTKDMEQYAARISAIEQCLEPFTSGKQRSALRWTCKSLRDLESELKATDMEFATIRNLLTEERYALTNRAGSKGASPKERYKQFADLNRLAMELLQGGQPVLYVEITRRKACSDSIDVQAASQSKDASGSQQTTSLRLKYKPAGEKPVDADIAESAAQAIRYWWKEDGEKRYSCSRKAGIIARFDRRGDVCCQLLKMALRRLPGASELLIHPLPPGISKWCALDHQLRCQCFSVPPREQGLFEVVLSLIGTSTLSKHGKPE